MAIDALIYTSEMVHEEFVVGEFVVGEFVVGEFVVGEWGERIKKTQIIP